MEVVIKMTNLTPNSVEEEIDRILKAPDSIKLVEYELSPALIRQGVTPNVYPVLSDKAKKDLATLLDQKIKEARIDEWKLISEVQHSAGITAELYFGKERDERINQLTNKEADDQPDKTEQDT